MWLGPLQVTTVLLEIINGLFAAYDADKTGRYLSKDAAIALLMSVTVKGATVASGVTDLNPAVDLAGHLSAHIIPELSVTDAAINELPIVKAACLKFVATFRSQFSNDQLVALLPMLIPFVGSTNVVVHTYAAAAIERLLMVKDKTTTTDATGLVISTTTTPRLSPEAVAANLEALFGAFFGLMVKTGACPAPMPPRPRVRTTTAHTTCDLHECVLAARVQTTRRTSTS